ncbi:MAG: cytidine deaminase [Planctomycetota bacterium]|jgi:cytidine deaminase
MNHHSNTNHSPISPKSIPEYIAMAQRVAQRAYNPYSRFAVGCVLVDRDGEEHIGCNVESASYSVTLCAERVAASHAVAMGKRNWQSIYIVSPTRVSPCGVCRQFLFEFCPDLEVYLGDLTTEETLGPIRLGDLLPFGMTLQQTPLPHDGT